MNLGDRGQIHYGDNSCNINKYSAYILSKAGIQDGTYTSKQFIDIITKQGTSFPAIREPNSLSFLQIYMDYLMALGEHGKPIMVTGFSQDKESLEKTLNMPLIERYLKSH